jgi:hypothetical protein
VKANDLEGFSSNLQGLAQKVLMFTQQVKVDDNLEGLSSDLQGFDFYAAAK